MAADHVCQDNLNGTVQTTEVPATTTFVVFGGLDPFTEYIASVSAVLSGETSEPGMASGKTGASELAIFTSTC